MLVHAHSTIICRDNSRLGSRYPQTSLRRNRRRYETVRIVFRRRRGFDDSNIAYFSHNAAHGSAGFL